MSIQLEFINFIIPISTIDEKYLGGWDQCLKDHENLIGGRVWYDSHLFRDGAMNSMDIGNLVDWWKEMGFTPTVEIDGESHWQDMCVVEGMFGGTTLNCDWLICEPNNTVHMKGDSTEKVFSRADFEREPSSD